MPIDPAFAVTGPDWSIPAVEAPTAPDAVGDGTQSSGGGFGTALSDAMGGLVRSQDQAAEAAQSLASGTATDPTAVVLAVERAQLTMHLATQLRTKAVESIQDIFHTQV